jgi:NAD(P)H-flavin reductase
MASIQDHQILVMPISRNPRDELNPGQYIKIQSPKVYREYKKSPLPLLSPYRPIYTGIHLHSTKDNSPRR